ncbi:unnamed protein product [Brassica rapa]|uniref:Uncharacterized protein n=1 Tax=Brassica campestris TaxID=3711 RepID=A0A8D9CV67_BRACM|nr:unnamed protein product [Brassica rapa]
MSASKFAIFCIVLICLASLHEFPLHTAEAPRQIVRRYVSECLVLQFHYTLPKRIVRRCVSGSIWGR